MEKARIILVGKNIGELDNVCGQVVNIAKNAKASIGGPIPFPTKHLKLVCRKNPSGEGNTSWERWEMRIHKRVIDIYNSEKVLREIMRVQVPDGVHIEIDISK